MREIVSIVLALFTLHSLSAKNTKTTVIQDTTVVSNENIQYKLVQDSENLQLFISTPDAKMSTAMLQRGLTIYFDIKGKEREDVAITYPIEPVRINFKREASLDGFPTAEEENKMKHAMALFIEDDLPQEAVYKYYDRQERFHVILNALDAAISYTYNEEKGLLTYHLKIPKYKISSNSKEDFSRLTIGVKTGTMKKSKPKAADDSRKSRSNTRGGGPPSGGRKGGGRSDPSQGERPEGGNRKSGAASIDFWFKASE